MKKLFIFVIIFAFSLSSNFAQTDIFDKRDLLFDVNIGMGLCSFSNHQEYNKQLTLPSGATYERISVDTSYSMAYFSVPLSVQYGFTKWLGLGARFSFTNYFPKADSIVNVVPKSRSFDAGIMADFHFIKFTDFELPFRAYFGYSSYKYIVNNKIGSELKDNGLSYGISIMPTYYYTDEFALFANVSYSGNNYSSVLLSDNNDVNLNNNANRDWLYKLNGNGFYVGVGCKLKFSIKKTY